MQSNWQTQIIDDPAAFAALGADWEALRAAQVEAQPFLAIDWLTAWWRSYGNGRLAVVTVRQDARLVAAAPCYVTSQSVRRVPGFTALRLLADTGVGSTYLDVMIDPTVRQPAMRALYLGLRACRADFWHFRPLHSDALLSELCAAHAGPATRIPGEASPTVDCHQPWDSYLQSLSYNKRKDIRRKFRDLEKVGPYVLREYCREEPQELATAIDLLAQFNRARFERIGIVGGFRDPQLAAFHRDLLPRLASSGVARLFVLWSQTTPIAALYLVCDKGHWCAYQSGFDLAWTEYGPGTLLDDLVMQRVMDRGEASVFDFCQGTQEYKMRYHSRLISTETIEVYGSHLTGRVARILASTRRQTAAPQKGKG